MVLGATLHPDFYAWGIWFGMIALVPSLWLAAKVEVERGRLRADRVAEIMAEEAQMAQHEAAGVTSLR